MAQTKFIFQALRLAALALLLAVPSVRATQNPLDTYATEKFDDKSAAIKVEPCNEGGNDLSNIHAGDFALFKEFDFDSGVAAFKARVASVNMGTIEVRLDRVDGPIIGRCKFESTSDWQFWKDVSCPVDNSQAGVRDVYLVFRGETTGPLVSIRSFSFLKSIVTDAT